MKINVRRMVAKLNCLWLCISVCLCTATLPFCVQIALGSHSQAPALFGWMMVKLSLRIAEKSRGLGMSQAR